MPEKLFTCQPSGMRAVKTGTVKRKEKEEIQTASELKRETEGREWG